ncbi:MAG: DNA gyrase C-terminal beta-propeller domain-containing protein, partial [Actinomycetales bacterium]
GGRLVDEGDQVLMVSSKGLSARFPSDDDTLRPMGRATGGVVGMKLKRGDATVSLDVIRPDMHEDAYVVTITDGGFGKRTLVSEWVPKGRAIIGVRAMRIVEERGSLVGAMVCRDTDTIFAIASNGVVIRTPVSEIRPSGRDTMGVVLMNLAAGDSVVAIARAGEAEDEAELEGEDVVRDEAELEEPAAEPQNPSQAP